MREAHPVERAVGIDHYVTDTPGVGGRLREAPEDFRVTELEAFDPEPLDADSGAYPHVLFRARLRGWDTNDFAGALADALEMSRERVSWAGTKDKHAVTTQLFSVHQGDPDALAAVDLADADLDVLGRTGRPIFFGDLAGNAFEVTVRGPDHPDRVADITDDLRAFAGIGAATSNDTDDAGTGDADHQSDPVTVGVPNYFGQQRFGSRRPVTHEVGLAIARGNWRDAALAYVGNPSEREPAETRAAREYVDETHDWAGGLDRMPEWLGYERAMLHELAERAPVDDEGFRAALETAPANVQQLFVNAAQSYVFNRVLSARLDRGLPFDRPVAGDVVCFADRDAPDGLALPDTDRTQRVDADRVDTVTRHCERGRAFVTAPLVGTETDLADGEPGDIERDVLSDVGIGQSDFDLPGEFHSTGTRRAILVRTDVTVERGGDTGGDTSDGDTSGNVSDGDDGHPSDDPLTFSFSLPKGSYATVLLREYLQEAPDAMG